MNRSLTSADGRKSRRRNLDPEELEQFAATMEQLARERQAYIQRRWLDYTKRGGHRDAQGRLLYTHALLQEISDVALGTLFVLAEEGDREAARYLVDRALGAPELPLSVRIPQMSLEESRAEIARTLKAANLSDYTAEGFLLALSQGTPEEPVDE